MPLKGIVRVKTFEGIYIIVHLKAFNSLYNPFEGIKHYTKLTKSHIRFLTCDQRLHEAYLAFYGSTRLKQGLTVEI